MLNKLVRSCNKNLLIILVGLIEISLPNVGKRKHACSKIKLAENFYKLIFGTQLMSVLSYIFMIRVF